MIVNKWNETGNAVEKLLNAKNIRITFATQVSASIGHEHKTETMKKKNEKRKREQKLIYKIFDT